jgi:hypothetical protein
MQSKSLIICGDSFNIGIGCRDLAKEPYGSLLGNALGIPVINLAKGSSTNLSIYLQAKYAVEELDSKDSIVLVSVTSYDRVEWFNLDAKPVSFELKLQDVNYHNYPPYGPYSYFYSIPHPMENRKDYTGKMYTENIVGIIDYWENVVSKNNENNYYIRFKNEPKERIKVLYDYGAMILDPRINKLQSIAMMNLSHTILRNAGIKHLILMPELETYAAFIPEKNLVNLSWGQLSLDYPDDLKTMHTGPEGHKVACQLVIDKLKENNWI